MTEEKAKTEIAEVSAGTLFADKYTGARTTCRKYVKYPDENKSVCITMEAPAPTDLNEWTKLTGMPASELAAKLTKTLIHSETWFDGAKEGLTFEEAQADKFIGTIASEIETAIQYVEKKASRAKVLAQEKAERDAKDRELKIGLGLDPECSVEEYMTALTKAVAKAKKKYPNWQKWAEMRETTKERMLCQE